MRRGGNFPAAAVAAREAVALQPDFAAAHQRLGLYLRETGDETGAAAALAEAARLGGAGE